MDFRLATNIHHDGYFVLVFTDDRLHTYIECDFARIVGFATFYSVYQFERRRARQTQETGLRTGFLSSEYLYLDRCFHSVIACDFAHPTVRLQSIIPITTAPTTHDHGHLQRLPQSHRLPFCWKYATRSETVSPSPADAAWVRAPGYRGRSHRGSEAMACRGRWRERTGSQCIGL